MIHVAKMATRSVELKGKLFADCAIIIITRVNIILSRPFFASATLP